MARVTHAVASRRRRKKILKKAKGYRGARGKALRAARLNVERALLIATVVSASANSALFGSPE